MTLLPSRSSLIGKMLGFALVLLSGCGGGSPTSGVIPVDGRRVPHEQLQRAVAALCDAQDFARRDDLENARAAFQDRAHDDLHTIAAALDDQDRATESRILRAKNRIESDFRGGDLAALKADFPELVDAAESGLRVLNVEPLPCG